MEGVKKWLNVRKETKNGLYVHYSPPKLLGVVASAQLRQWLREGAGHRLERAVLAGQGRRLLGEAEAKPLARHLPALVAKCEALHAAVERGSLLQLQDLLNSEFNKKKFASCLDEAGVGLLHKAVYYDFADITAWLVQNFPHLVSQRDSAGRTPLHYVGMCRDEAATAALLEGAGAARGARDGAGRTPGHYRGRTRPLLPATAGDMTDKRNPPGLVIKRHNIRIWCHDCDMAKLQRVVWEGHGTRLLSEVCNQPVVKKFLEAVPYIMNTIREIHTAVVHNRLEDLMKHAGDPVPPVAMSSRDANNLTVMHKAAGLGHGGILKYITDRYPQGINDADNDGRTPLHYAAAVRDEQHLFNTLVDLGADESVVDIKNKTPGYYLNRQQEIDKTILKTIPEAPRTPSSAYPSTWDWKLLETEAVVQELNKKSRRRVKASNENISSNNTNTVSECTKEYRTGGMKASSTHEFIKDLPDLNDLKKSQDNLHQESQVVEESHDPDSNEVAPAPENDPTEEQANGSPEPETIDDNNTQELEQENNANEDDQKEDTPENNEEEEDSKKGKAEEIDNNISDNEESQENQNETNEEKIEVKAEDETEHQKHTNDAELGKGEDEEVDENGDAKDKTEQEDEKNYVKIEEETNNETNPHIEEQNIENKSDAVEKTEDSNNKEEGEDGHDTTESEGNNNEDDDDVQTQGETPSEYSNFNLTSTAEASDTASAKRGYQTGGRNTQESLIEGLVSGEAEMDSQDASLNHEDDSVQADVLVVDNEIDPEVTELINNANMEMLAALVLNGEGARLVGRQSRNTELQAFLDNVPTYMKKIHKVHIAAREGNIRDLQAALDRRKFAIARDAVSPNGATPLHVATVFGKTNIIKYLGGRFPETLSAVDFEGRTALHYAAVLPDNGHYYNLLQQLGANSKDLDDNGRSAEDYSKNSALLPFDQILTDFGISDDALQDMLSDKGGSHASNGQMDIPIFKTEEGRYLAKSLGDPLIKGLTEVANVKPKDPVAFLASFLQNFPEHEKTRLGTQETNVLVMSETPEVENEAPPRVAPEVTAAPPVPIDVITVERQPEINPDTPEVAFSSTSRDEHGQSMLHFAVARTHTHNALFELLQESDINLAYRDELYRTARDVSIQANLLENTAEIDRWVVHLAARGNTEKIMELLLEGYDHILNVVDEEGVSITEVVSQRNNATMSSLLASIPTFEESRESLHGAIRRGDLRTVQQSCETEGGRTLARGKNSFGRTALHVAVLAQREEIVSYLAQTFPELLRIGDNLERSPLHYAMGVDNMESLSRVLIRSGAKRVLKDLKGRQPSYYFMNKSDILRLKEEEEVY